MPPPPLEGEGPGSLAGQLLEGRYRLESLIAVGGMGEVWRARDELLERPVAVKLVKDAFASDDAFLSRFRSEARIAAALSHQGIAHVFDYGEPGDKPPQRPFLVMELVEGRSLSAVIAESGALPAGVAIDIIAQVARALAAAHKLGITHCDIKPANLLITSDSRVKITDFGIASAAPGSQARAPGAHAPGPDDDGLVLGTAAYIAPERVEGRPPTPASDVYSLGIVGYQCIAGRLPFSASTQQAAAMAHADIKPPALPAGVPAAVRDLIMRMIARDPWDRPRTALEVADAASRVRDELLITDGPQLAEVASSPAPQTGGILAAEDGEDTTAVQAKKAIWREFHRRRRRRALATVAAVGGGTGILSSVIAAAVIAGNSGAGKHPHGHVAAAKAPTHTPQPSIRATTPRPSRSPQTRTVGTSQTAPSVHPSGPPAPPPRSRASAPAAPPAPAPVPSESSSPSPSPSQSPSPGPPTPTPPPTNPPPGAQG